MERTIWATAEFDFVTDDALRQSLESDYREVDAPA